MVELKEKEERLRFLLSKIDSEIEKFKEMQASVEERKMSINRDITSKGLSEVPLEIRPHSDEQDGLGGEVNRHLMELSKMRNYLNGKLELVIKEEELLKELKKKHGNKVSLVKTDEGEFEIVYEDSETEEMYDKLKASRKLIADLKSSMKDIIKDEE